MELVFLLFMLVAGGGLAAFVMTATAIAQKENERGRDATAIAQRDSVAASLLFHVLVAGEVQADEALRQVRRGSGIAAPVTRGIDVANWAESFGRNSSDKQKHDLLETAVQLVAAHSPIPVRQYAALLDLSFGLGFHTDALAKLRAQYGFDYIDHAKDARPRAADRSGGAAPLFVRSRDREELLRVLGVSGTPSRQELTAAYRKLAAQNHPDRYHGAPSEAQSDAATRFIEITRAYEELLHRYPES
ncbi:MAG TPA: DnaJ domain-containing protein [Thermoanaerobaculia bacterium]|nr:DnaJ domain-containing protein [Thermoanaerobaculia bacterium]